MLRTFYTIEVFIDHVTFLWTLLHTHVLKVVSAAGSKTITQHESFVTPRTSYIIPVHRALICMGKKTGWLAKGTKRYMTSSLYLCLNMYTYHQLTIATVKAGKH